MGLRLAAAALFVGMMALAVYALPDDWGDRHETLATVSFLGLYFLTGAMIGRWWALLLPFVPVALQVPLGVQGDVDGVATWKWSLLDTVLIFFWIMLAGVFAGWGARVALRRGRARGGPDSLRCERPVPGPRRR